MNDQPIKIEFALNFRRSLKQIKKHYHHAAEDLKSLTDRLEQGEVVGDQIQGVGYTVLGLSLEQENEGIVGG